MVSVLFADLVGFTPFAEERDAEDVRDTLTRYFDIARDVVERYGGTIEKFIGDAVMAVWGAPTAQEDDAERAVRAALDLVDAVRGLGAGIQARAGVLTGEASVTIGATNQGMVAGDLVNTASRLQGAAEPGTVLVGDATRRAAGEAIVFEEEGEKSFKGKETPVNAWRAIRVVAQRGGRGRADTLEAPFVGRDDEMRLLKELFHVTNRDRRPRLISVIGPGGIGKSRLAWEFLKYIDGLSEAIYWHDGRSPAYGEGITFWALGEMVRERAGLLESDDAQTTREKLATSVREHVPNEQERPAIERALLVLLGFESGVDPQQLFGAWRTFFERLAEKSPVVMVFEDLHFADSGLLDFIDHVQEWSRNSPITIITLARPELLEKRTTWGAGKRSFSSIYLEPLSDENMRLLLTGLVPGLTEKQVAPIVARADGIPMYAVETVRMLLAQGKLVLVDGVYRPTGNLDEIAVPETLTALIAARLDGLDADDRAVIADAAVLGQTFTLQALSALAGVEPAALQEQLAALVRRELLQQQMDPRSPELGQYAFVQALIREVAYNTLSKKDRKTRHLAAARFLDTLGTEEVAGGLAGHYLAAYRFASDTNEADALKAQARVALRAAGERAAALGSHAQGITFYEQAIEITTNPPDLGDLHQRAMTSALEGLSGEVVLLHAEGALAAQREIGDREAIALATADYLRAVSNSKNDPKRALEMALKAWDEFSDLESTRAGVNLMAVVGSLYGTLDMVEDESRWREKLIVIAERLDLTGELITAMVGLGGLYVGTDRPRLGLVLLRGAHSMAIASDDRRRERNSRQSLIYWEQWNDPASGLALTREGLDIARQIGSLLYGANMVGNGVVCALRVGEWGWATDLLEEWIPDDAAEPGYSEFFGDRAVLTAVRGGDPTNDLDRATELRASITDPQYEAYDHWFRAWAAFSAGRFDEAYRLARKAPSLNRFFHPLVTPVLLHSALWAGDIPAAQGWLDTMNGTMHRGEALGRDLESLAAGIEALQGRRGEALAKYREALAGYRSLGLAFDEALAVLDMVRLLGADEPEVKSAAEWARATLTRFGATPLVERLETALAVPARVTAEASNTAAAARVAGA